MKFLIEWTCPHCNALHKDVRDVTTMKSREIINCYDDDKPSCGKDVILNIAAHKPTVTVQKIEGD